MVRWSKGVRRLRTPIALGWLVITILGFFLSGSLNSRLSSSLSVPKAQSEQANNLLREHFAENIEGAFSVIYNFKQATPNQIDGFKREIIHATQHLPGVEVIQQRAVGGTLYSLIQTQKGLMDAAALTDSLRADIRNAGIQGALVTGAPALAQDLKPVLNEDLQRGELLAVLLALIFLIAVLGFSWSVLIPFLVSAATIGSSIAILDLIAGKTLIVMYTPNVIELIALGLAIDYTLLLVQRYRHEGSIEEMMATAGRTVLLSGMTVAIGIAALIAMPLPFMRSLGVAGLLVPLMSLATSLTLTPALLSLLGPAAVKPIFLQGLLSRSTQAHGIWGKIADSAIARPKRLLALALLPLIALGSLSLAIDLTPSSTFALPSFLESSKALGLLAQTAGPGLITPNEILIDLGQKVRADSSSVQAARIALASTLSKDRESFMVFTGIKAPYVDSTGRYLRIIVVGRHELGSPATKNFVAKLREHYLSVSNFPQGTRLFLAGAPAQGVDYIETAYSSFRWIGAVVLILTFLLLWFRFKSWVVPAVTALLNLLSVSIAYALLVVTFIWGWGSHILGTYQVNQIEAWVPIFLFAILTGLSMDYQLFIVMRVREGQAQGLSPHAAIRYGLVQTGAVVTSAAIILIGALTGLIFGHIASLQELGIGLAAGLLIDATIIRGVILPSILALLGSRKPRR